MEVLLLLASKFFESSIVSPQFLQVRLVLSSIVFWVAINGRDEIKKKNKTTTHELVT